MTSNGAAFFERIRTEARTRLAEYLAAHPVPRDEEAMVEVLIKTAGQLPASVEKGVRKPGHEAGRPYPRVRTTVEFDIDRAAVPFRVSCSFVRLAGGGTQSSSADEEDDQPKLLILRYHSLRFDNVLYSRKRWVPMVRP